MQDLRRKKSEKSENKDYAEHTDQMASPFEG